MKRSVWLFSVFIATIFLLGNWISEFSGGTNFNKPYPPVLASTQSVLAFTQSEPITPAERKNMETLALDFTKGYYTYTLDNYLEAGEELLPLLAEEYQEIYQSTLAKSYSAAQAVDAESSVLNAFIINIDKNGPDTGIIKVQFKAKVLTHKVETLNRYNIVLELKKDADDWLINNILEEEPVAFSNLQGLL